MAFRAAMTLVWNPVSSVFITYRRLNAFALLSVLRLALTLVAGTIAFTLELDLVSVVFVVYTAIGIGDIVGWLVARKVVSGWRSRFCTLWHSAQRATLKSRHCTIASPRFNIAPRFTSDLTNGDCETIWLVASPAGDHANVGASKPTFFFRQAISGEAELASSCRRGTSTNRHGASRTSAPRGRVRQGGDPEMAILIRLKCIEFVSSSRSRWGTPYLISSRVCICLTDEGEWRSITELRVSVFRRSSLRKPQRRRFR